MPDAEHRTDPLKSRKNICGGRALRIDPAAAACFYEIALETAVRGAAGSGAASSRGGGGVRGEQRLGRWGREKLISVRQEEGAERRKTSPNAGERHKHRKGKTQQYETPSCFCPGGGWGSTPRILLDEVAGGVTPVWACRQEDGHMDTDRQTD